MSFVKRFLGFDASESPRAASAAETETVRKIIEALELLEPPRARRLAAFAYILGRVAYADREISPAETRAMERIIMDDGGMPEEQAVLVVQIAKSQNLLFGGTENFLVTREFGSIATHEEKLALLECLFAVSASDDSIVSAEDTEIRKVASEMGLSHADFIAARLRYRDYLEVLKKQPGPGSTTPGA